MLNVSLNSPDLERFVQSKLTSGEFKSAEDVLAAGLLRLMHEEYGPGELEVLIAEGQAAIDRGEVVDGKEAFNQVRRRNAEP